MVYEPLVAYTETGGPEPALADSWEFSGDGCRVSFELRQGVRFHDGTAFDAEAVKWNVDRWVGKEKFSFFRTGDLKTTESPYGSVDQIMISNGELANNHPNIVNHALHSTCRRTGPQLQHLQDTPTLRDQLWELIRFAVCGAGPGRPRTIATSGLGRCGDR